MNPITAWIKQPKATVGQDHLGSQAPCINLYGRLLPGITNVTDRARYYSFYPWFFWAYEKTYKSIIWDEVVSRYRKADCLFTLIAARHANQTDQNDDNHGIAMIGRNTLVKALHQLETDTAPLLLSTYATRESNTSNRYFKNKLGGLGQYYLGTFRDLGLLEGNSRTGVQYTVPRADEIAESFDSSIDRKLFFNAIDNDVITTEALDQLKSFCPCFLSTTVIEKSNLIDIFFDRNKIYGDEGDQRKSTLRLFLSLIDQLEQINPENPDVLDHFLFRNSVYSGYLNPGIRWTLPDILENVRKDWAIYQRNELLSIALQSIFWVTLRLLSESGSIYYSSEHFINDLSESGLFKRSVNGQENVSLLDYIKDQKNNLPSLASWGDAYHECYIARRVSENCSNKASDPDYELILTQSLNILITLAARIDSEYKPYGSFLFPDNYFSYYPINLHSFQYNLSNKWNNLSLQDFIAWLAYHWGIETHLHVALRKMRQSKLNTFRVRPTDEGLKVVDTEKIPEPVLTTPRFTQGIKMLWDIGAIIPGPNRGSYKITELGRELLNAAN